MTTPHRYIPENAKRWKDAEGRPIAIAALPLSSLLPAAGCWIIKTRGSKIVRITPIQGFAAEWVIPNHLLEPPRRFTGFHRFRARNCSGSQRH